MNTDGGIGALFACSLAMIIPKSQCLNKKLIENSKKNSWKVVLTDLIEYTMKFAATATPINYTWNI